MKNIKARKNEVGNMLLLSFTVPGAPGTSSWDEEEEFFVTRKEAARMIRALAEALAE